MSSGTPARSLSPRHASLALLVLAACRVLRDEPPAADAGRAIEDAAAPAPVLELGPPSLLVEDAGMPRPFHAIAPLAAGPKAPPDAPTVVAEPAVAEPDAGAAREEPPRVTPARAAVVVLARGLAAQVQLEVAHEACRAIALERLLWPTLDQGLRQLACALRATARAPREALVMDSDGRLGATGALPFDLDPARVVAVVRDRMLGSVVADGARALVGASASWRCGRADAPAESDRGSDAGYALLVLRDLRGAITAGLVMAPPQARPEGWLSAAVVPGDSLFVGGDSAAAVFGADMRLRAQGRARRLQERAARSEVELAAGDPLLQGVEQYVWLDRARVGSPDTGITRIEWARDSVPAPCRPAPPPAPQRPEVAPGREPEPASDAEPTPASSSAPEPEAAP
jgi:hypothetical protein